jgi:hypothetical protein
LEWHLRQAWAPILFHDHDRAVAEQARISPVATIEISDAAKRKRSARRNDDGVPVGSFRNLIDHLAAMTLNLVASPQAPNTTITLTAKPTPLQNNAFQLLDVTLPRVQQAARQNSQTWWTVTEEFHPTSTNFGLKQVCQSFPHPKSGITVKERLADRVNLIVVRACRERKQLGFQFRQPRSALRQMNLSCFKFGGCQ